MVEKPKRRSQTSPGLGDSGLRPRQIVQSAPPSVSSVSSIAPLSSPASAEKVSGRRERSSRAPIRVDEVGDVAVAIATKAVQTSAPKLLKTRRELTSAPINHRDAFVLSLIDGKMNIQAIVDIAGMPGHEIIEILERLARLGIVSMP